MKLTVKEYAEKFNISPQSVYKKVKNNSLKWFKENGVIYIKIVDNKGNIEEKTDFKLLNYKFKMVENELKAEIKLLQRELEFKNREIQRLEEIIKSQKQTIEAEQRTNMSLLHSVKQLEYKKKKFLGIF